MPSFLDRIPFRRPDTWLHDAYTRLAQNACKITFPLTFLDTSNRNPASSLRAISTRRQLAHFFPILRSRDSRLLRCYPSWRSRHASLASLASPMRVSILGSRALTSTTQASRYSTARMRQRTGCCRASLEI